MNIHDSPLPTSGSTGAKQNFLARVKQHNDQRIHDQVMANSAKVKQANDAKAAVLATAHREAVKRVNSLRFDRLYFLTDGAVRYLDANRKQGQAAFGQGGTTAFAIDQSLNQMAFWAKSGAEKLAIHTAKLDGSAPGLIELGWAADGDVSSIVADPESERLFFVAGSSIIRVKYDGSSVLVLTRRYDEPSFGPAASVYSKLGFGPHYGGIFWTEESGIGRSGHAGTWHKPVVSATEAPAPVDVVVDDENQKLYWVDQELQYVRRSTLDGRSIEDLYPVDHPMPGLALDEVSAASGLSQEVYWSGWDDQVDPETGISTPRYYVARGPVDGSGPTERLYDIASDGPLVIVSKLIAANEAHLVAARKKKDAQDKAARDIAQAHADHDHAVYLKHQALLDAHTKATEDVDAKNAEHAKARADNQAALAKAKDDAAAKVKKANDDAAKTRNDANSAAAAKEAAARATAAAAKRDATAKHDAAVRERAKY